MKIYVFFETKKKNVDPVSKDMNKKFNYRNCS